MARLWDLSHTVTIALVTVTSNLVNEIVGHGCYETWVGDILDWSLSVFFLTYINGKVLSFITLILFLMIYNYKENTVDI